MPPEPRRPSPADETVAERLLYFRGVRGMTVPQLVAAIERQTGRRYQRTALTKIENGDRGVLAGDLVAIAAGLRVLVTDLLMPSAAYILDPVITSASAAPVSADVLWRWFHARGAGVTGEWAGQVVPVDQDAYMTELLASNADLVRQIQEQQAATADDNNNNPRKGIAR